MTTQSRLRNILVSILLFTVLLLVHLVFGEKEVYQGLIYFSIALVFVFILDSKGYQIPILGIFVLFIAAMLDATGNILELYGGPAWYDLFTHSFTSGAMVLFLSPYTQRFFKEVSVWKVALIAFLASVFFASLYEVGELWIQRILNVRMIWGELDTPLDMQWNIIGALLGFGAWVFFKKTII